MKARTRQRIDDIVAKYAEYGITHSFCIDALDSCEYTMPDSVALDCIEAAILYQFAPDQLTEHHKSLMRHKLRRDKITIS